MDDLDLHLALEALRTNPAAHPYHERITRGMQAIEQGTLTPFERDALHRLLERFPSTTPSPDPVAALIAAFQRELPQHDPAAVATAIQHALAQRPATLNGAPVTIRMDGDTHAHQANLAIGNQVGGNLVQVTVTIPIPDARFDALLATALKTHEQEKTLARIRHAAQQIESDRLLNLRLEGFVGRVAELAAIREHIATMRPTGGYVLIKAAAGEGKSSSIAKLIQEAGIAATPHHFIALTTGREYQLGLLRAVVAQLILKHGLTVSYFPEESYPAMKGEFVRILDELSKQGIEETIYLDGLDQLQPEIDGSRDLSFLPPQPPPGIVMVLGSRPDETLKPLEIFYKINFPLPPLSEPDALDLWYSVQPGLVSIPLKELYKALKGNALFVHLAANTIRNQTISDAIQLVKQIEQNPNNLFGITLTRIKNRSELRWPTIWKPMLALLLVAQEPLMADTVGTILNQEYDALQDAITIMGGLISQGVDQRIALHHLLFRDYLAGEVFNTREIRYWHQRLADWCAIDLDTIWTDHNDYLVQAHRIYARYHYITHLALAENWTALWKVLDAGTYGHKKNRFDPSTRLYSLDLDQGRQSAIKAGQSTEEHIQNLPRLWKYSLLRTRLSHRADQWPDDMFITLAITGQIQEALARIELCSDTLHQIILWEKLVWLVDPDQQATFLYRMQRAVDDLPREKRSVVLIAIAKAYANLGKLDTAIHIGTSLELTRDRDETFTSIAKIAIKMGHYKQVITIIQLIVYEKNRVDILRSIAQAISIDKNINDSKFILDYAKQIAKNMVYTPNRDQISVSIAKAHASFNCIEQAIIIADTINDLWTRNNALESIVQIMASTGNIKHAITIANTISDSWKHADALIAITSYVASIGNIEHAITIANTISDSWKHADALIAIIPYIASTGNIEQVMTMIQSMTEPYKHLDALIALVQHMPNTNQAYQPTILLEQAYTIAIKMPEEKDRIEALTAIAKACALIGDQDKAMILIEESTNLAERIDRLQRKRETLAAIAKTAADGGFYDMAVAIAIKLDSQKYRSDTLAAIAKTAADGGFYDTAVAIAIKLDSQKYRSDTLAAIAKTAALTGDYDLATTIIGKTTETALTGTERSRVETLISITQTLTTFGYFEQSINITKNIDDYWKKNHAFIFIAKQFTIRGDIEQALMVIKYIDDINNHIEILINIATLYSTTTKSREKSWELLDQATKLTESITDNRDSILVSIVKAYIATENPDQAIIITNSITISVSRIESIRSIINFLSINRDINKIISIIQIIEPINQIDILIDIIESISLINKNNELEILYNHIIDILKSTYESIQHTSITKIIRKLLDKGFYELAIDITRYAKEKSEIFSIIAYSYANSGYPQYSLTFIDKSINEINNSSKPNYNSDTIINISNSYAIIGKSTQSISILNKLDKNRKNSGIIDIIKVITKKDLSEALSITNNIDDKITKMEAFLSIINVLISQKDFIQAKKLLIEITPFLDNKEFLLYHSRMIELIVEASAYAHFFENALNIVKSIRSIERRAYLFKIIAKSAINAGNIELSRIIVTENNVENRDEILLEIANTYIILGNIKQAIGIAGIINDMKKYSEVLVTLANAYHKIGSREKALNTALSIGDTKKRSDILLSFIQKYSDDNEWILRIIHNEWNSCKTHNDMWIKTQLITPLLKDYPWLGMAILEEEAWVNEQLKRLG